MTPEDNSLLHATGRFDGSLFNKSTISIGLGKKPYPTSKCCKRITFPCTKLEHGLARFRQARLVQQQYCAFCDAPLAKLTDPVSQGEMRLERLIDELLRLDTAECAQDDRKFLAARLMKHPVPVGAARSTLPRLSHALRHDFFPRPSASRIGIESHKIHGPLTLWTRLANATDSHNGLVGVLADRLTEIVGLERAGAPKPPDLAALLQAAIRLHEGRRLPVETRAASHTSGASEDSAKPASASCSGSGRSRKDVIPKAAKNASVVTKV